jgi:cytochrome c556
MKTLCALTLSAMAALTAIPASAQFAKPEDAIKYRQGALTVMAQHFGRVGAMVNGRVPFDAKVAQENADIVAYMAKLPWAGFAPGTEGGKAKADIWKEDARFQDLASKMQAETVKLAAAAKSGNLDSVKTAFGATANSCKACHDAFRAR